MGSPRSSTTHTTPSRPNHSETSSSQFVYAPAGIYMHLTPSVEISNKHTELAKSHSGGNETLVPLGLTIAAFGGGLHRMLFHGNGLRERKRAQGMFQGIALSALIAGSVGKSLSSASTA